MWLKKTEQDGSGYISAAELRHVLTNFGEKYSDEEIQDMISEADPLNSGKIYYDDFIKKTMSN